MLFHLKGCSSDVIVASRDAVEVTYSDQGVGLGRKFDVKIEGLDECVCFGGGCSGG